MNSVGAVLLAAGNSTRYQGNKLLDVIEGKKMYLHILEMMQGTVLSPKVIVTQYDEIRDSALLYDFTPVINEKPELGISSSLQLGLLKVLELKPDTEGVMFGVCDQPYLQPESMERLIGGFLSSDKNMAALAYDGRLGNPCIFGRRYYEELLSLTGDVGGKSIMKRHLADVLLVPSADRKELTDIDEKVMDKNMTPLLE